MEYENVREALDVLVSFNDTNRDELTVDGKQMTFGDLQDLNREIAYNIADLLGMSDLYLDRK
jgi:hypothetical protein